MKRNRLLSVIKNLFYSTTANLIVLAVNVIVVLLLPKILGTSSYGYYQLYVFYTSYVGIAYLGWCEGIYLRIGGKKYDDLDKRLYSSQFKIFTIFIVAVFSVIFILAFLFAGNVDKRFVIECTCVVGIFMCQRWFVTTLLQATYRVKEYALVTVSEKILFIAVTIIFIIIGVGDFKTIVVSAVISVFVSLCIGIWFCRKVIFSKTNFSPDVFREIRDNISAGIKLMVSTLSSMLIIGIVRMGIENHWSIETFGKISLTLSVSNMLIVAINAVGVVIYPILRRTVSKNLPEIYKLMRMVLMSGIFFVLVFYYPVQKILSLWLPQYAESLRYAAILFPICVYESKMSLLINTYYNTLRLENTLMKCNISAVFLSAILTIVSIYIFDSIFVSMLAILVVIVFRCILSELFLAKHIAIDLKKDIVIELTMTTAFIICNWFFGLAGMLAYAVCYIVYLLLKRSDLKEAFAFVKSMR